MVFDAQSARYRWQKPCQRWLDAVLTDMYAPRRRTGGNTTSPPAEKERWAAKATCTDADASQTQRVDGGEFTSFVPEYDDRAHARRGNRRQLRRLQTGGAGCRIFRVGQHLTLYAWQHWKRLRRVGSWHAVMRTVMLVGLAACHFAWKRRTRCHSLREQR